MEINILPPYQVTFLLKYAQLINGDHSSAESGKLPLPGKSLLTCFTALPHRQHLCDPGIDR